MIKKVLFLFLFLSCSFHLFSQDFEFYKEDLYFEITDHNFYVKGIYYFSNTSGETIMKPIFYPFPLDKKLYGAVDSVYIIDINANAAVQNFADSAGVNFYIYLDAYKSTKFQISYKQKLLSDKAEYILLTTKNWGKPFDQANYQLSISDCKINSFSIPPDSSAVVNNKNMYFWDKHDYMPESNMVFHFNYIETKK